MFEKSIYPNQFIILLLLSFLFFSSPILGQETQSDTTKIQKENTTKTTVDFGTLEETEVSEEVETTDEETEKEEGDMDDDGDDGFHVTFNNSSWIFDDGSDLRLGLMDFGFSTYLSDNSINLPAELDEFDLLYDGSLNFNLHVVRHRVPIIKSHFSLEYGLSFSFMNYKFANDFKIIPDQLSFQTEYDGTKYTKNKLKTSFLEIPLLFTITPGKRKSFYLSGGWYGGVLLGSKQKLKAENGEKMKIKDDFNLNKFRYGAVGRIGLGPLAFYVQYSMNGLFKEDQGPELTPFNVGITFLNF